jgi:hypothetical protein
LITIYNSITDINIQGEQPLDQWLLTLNVYICNAVVDSYQDGGILSVVQWLLTLNVYICNAVVDTVIKIGEPYLWCNGCSP